MLEIYESYTWFIYITKSLLKNYTLTIIAGSLFCWLTVSVYFSLLCCVLLFSFISFNVIFLEDFFFQNDYCTGILQ